MPVAVEQMASRYRERVETTLLDAASAATSLNMILTADKVDHSAITGQMHQAFDLAFPGAVLEDRLEAIDTYDTAQLSGFMSNWRGKYFEVLGRDELNTGGQVGELVLEEGQVAVLAEDISQPGWDLQIVGDSGMPVSEIQLKATNSVGYLKDALERYADIEILATDEAAQAFVDGAVMESGIENAEMVDDLSAPVDDLLDSPLTDAVEAFGMGLPIILIAGTEGAGWMVRKRSLAQALERTGNRATRSGIAMAAGAAAAAAGAAPFAIPITLLTRLGIARHDVASKLGEHVTSNAETVRKLGDRRSISEE